MNAHAQRNARRKLIGLVFATLEAGGSKPPPSLDDPLGKKLALEVWTSTLADVDEVDLLAAVTTYLRKPDSRWWPTPGVLLDLVPGRRKWDDADATWGEVLVACGKFGRNRPPTTGPGVTPDAWWLDKNDGDRDAAMRAGVQALGGWQRLCAIEDGDITAARAAFRSAYRSELDRRRFTTQTDTARMLLAESRPSPVAIADREST